MIFPQSHERERFDIRNYLDSLTPVKGKHRYECPVCGGHALTVNPKTGAYKCWSNECDSKDIREAIAPQTNILGNTFSPSPQRRKLKPKPKPPTPAPIPTAMPGRERKSTGAAGSGLLPSYMRSTKSTSVPDKKFQYKNIKDSAAVHAKKALQASGQEKAAADKKIRAVTLAQLKQWKQEQLRKLTVQEVSPSPLELPPMSGYKTIHSL